MATVLADGVELTTMGHPGRARRHVVGPEPRPHVPVAVGNLPRLEEDFAGEPEERFADDVEDHQVDMDGAEGRLHEVYRLLGGDGAQGADVVLIELPRDEPADEGGLADPLLPDETYLAFDNDRRGGRSSFGSVDFHRRPDGHPGSLRNAKRRVQHRTGALARVRPENGLARSSMSFLKTGRTKLLAEG